MPSMHLIHQCADDEDEDDESSPSSSIPQEYIWPEHERPSCINTHSNMNEHAMSVLGHGHDGPMMMMMTKKCANGSAKDDVPFTLAQLTNIPIIDFQQLIRECDGGGAHDHAHKLMKEFADDENPMVSKLSYACKEWGIFYLINHGVPSSLMREVREKATHMFSLPLETKMRATREDGSFEGYGKAIIGKFFKSLMWSEGITVRGHPSESSIANIIDKLFPPHGSADNESIRVALEEYDLVMRRLAVKLLSSIIEGIGVNMTKFKRTQFDPERDCNGVLQLNHYPPCPQPLMTIGLPAHTDSTCLSILEQGDVAGLQIHRNGAWVPILPIQDSLVIHVGDMLQVLSNGKYKSILHRAIANKEKSRISLVYLCVPPLNVPIAPCHEEMESTNTNPIYKPMRWKDYLQAKNKYFLDALDHFKCK